MSEVFKKDKPKYIGVCNPVTDYTVRLPKKEIQEIIDLTNSGMSFGEAFDVSSGFEAIQERLEYIIKENNTTITAGGSVANTIKTLAMLPDSTRKFDFELWSNINFEDEAGSILIQNAKDCNCSINSNNFNKSKSKSPRCIVLIDDESGERTFFYLDGWPIPGFNREELIEKVRLEKPNFVLLEGFAFCSDNDCEGIKIDNVYKTCKQIKEINPNIKIHLSPSLSAHWQITIEQMQKIVSENLVDRLYLDDDQFMFYFGSKDERCDIIDNSLLCSIAKYETEFFITRAGKNVITVINGVMQKHKTLKLPPEKVKDANGAGDTFAAGIAYFLDIKYKIEKIMICSPNDYSKGFALNDFGLFISAKEQRLKNMQIYNKKAENMRVVQFAHDLACSKISADPKSKLIKGPMLTYEGIEEFARELTDKNRTNSQTRVNMLREKRENNNGNLGRN